MHSFGCLAKCQGEGGFSESQRNSPHDAADGAAAPEGRLIGKGKGRQRTAGGQLR